MIAALRRVPPWVAVPMLCAFAFTAPAWGDPLHRFVGRSEGEIRDHAWVAWLVHHRITVEHALPLRFPMAGFPRGIALYPLDPLNQLAVTALAPLVGLAPALLALTTALLALSGIAGGRLAVALGAGSARATAVAVAVMLGPPVLGPFVDGQTEGMGAGWALMALATLVGPEPWTWRRGLRLGLEGAALIASAPYQAHAWTLVGGLLVGALALRRRLPRAALWALVVLLPVGLACGAGLHHAESGQDGQITARTRSGAWPPRTMAKAAVLPPVQPQVGVTPTPVAAWPRELRYLAPTTGPRRWSGVVLPVAAALAALATLRRGTPAGRRRAAWALLGGAGVYAALAAGSAHDHGLERPLPFDLWYRYYPLGRLAWKPQQYAVPAWQLASVAIGLLPTPVAGLAAAAIGVEVLATGPVRLPLPALALEPQPWMTTLRDTSPGPVIEFPSRARSQIGSGAMPWDELLAQTVHAQPIGDPFGRGENPIYQGVEDALGRAAGWRVPPAAPNVSTALSVAEHAGFRALVVHAETMSVADAGRLRASLEPWLGAPTDLRGVWLWTLPAP